VDMLGTNLTFSFFIHRLEDVQVATAGSSGLI
jgi:hypothetical protein